MSPVTPISCGSALLLKMFWETACLDASQGHPGRRVTGKFDPTKLSSKARYGIEVFAPGIEFIKEQNAGAHSTAAEGMPPNFLAVELLPKVLHELGFVVQADLKQDELDLNMLTHATRWVLEQALAFGLVKVEPPAEPVHPPQPPAPPIPDPGTLTPAAERVEELWGWVVRQWPIVRPVAIEALEMFRKAIRKA